MIERKLQDGILRCTVNGLQIEEIQMNYKTLIQICIYPLKRGWRMVYQGINVVENNLLKDDEIKLIISNEKYYQKDETIVEINQYLMC
ncbi:MAG: hypothetical protein RR942_06655 [Romboutsia sp.]